MNKKATFLLALLSILILQTFTYFYFGLEQLQKELIPDSLGKIITEASDSAFVCDFYVTDCPVGDPLIYFSHNLQKEEAQIKILLKTKKIHFQSPQQFRWNDKPEEKYQLQYFTYCSRQNWITLFGFFTAKQWETIIKNNRFGIDRDAQFIWFLFTWIKTSDKVHRWKKEQL